MTDEILRDFARRLRERLGPHFKQLILFGSRARGDHEPDSDYDFLVIVDERTSEVEEIVQDIAYDMLDKHGFVFSLFPVSAHRFAEDKYEPLFMNIRREGVVIETG